MSAAILFEQLTRDELRAVAPSATVIVPLGATEQHGPHLPVSTDTIIVSALAGRSASEAGEISVVVTPAVPIGCSHHHLPFGGTMTVSARAYCDLLVDLGEALVSSGFARLLFLNGHGGNVAGMNLAVDRLVYERALQAQVAATSYWTCAEGVLGEFADIGPVPGHAGAFETSCLLALRPELVRSDCFPAPSDEPTALVASEIPGLVVRRPGVWEASGGYSDDARRADGDRGEQALDAIARRVGAALEAFHNSTPEAG